MSDAQRRYRVREVLGAGAFGTVYRADTVGVGQGDFSRTVAIKVLHRDHARRPAVVQRLRDEARMLATLKHRAIVRVDDLVQMEGSWAIVMELVEGVDLARVAEWRPLPPGAAVEATQEVASALRVAWEQTGDDGVPLRLLHRDIKPGNIALTPTGEVRLLDFGIARADMRGREARTESGLLGTLAFMAPECFDTGPEHASDVFALGATLYELLSGEMLGRTSTDRGRHDERVDAALDSLPADVKARTALVDLLRAMLAYEASERPTARDVERRLRDLRPSLGEPWLADWAPEVVATVRALAPPPDGRLAGTLLEETSGATTPAPTFDEVIAPPPSGRGLAVAVLAVALLGALAVFAAVGVGGAGLYLWGPFQGPLEPVVVAPAPAEAPEPAVAPDPVVPDAVPVAEDPFAVGPEPIAPEPVVAPRPVPEPLAATPPTTVVAPRPAPAPRPTPAPEPAPVPRVRTGAVSASGAAERVVLVSGEARYVLPADVPPGTYAIEAVFPGRSAAPAGTVTVRPDDVVSLECKTGFFLCQPR